MAKKKLPDLQIAELLLVKAGDDWTRTFLATIKREFDNEGNPIICGEVVIEDCKIISRAVDEVTLLKNMDDICLMILDHGMHSLSGVIMQILGEDFFLN